MVAGSRLEFHKNCAPSYWLRDITWYRASYGDRIYKHGSCRQTGKAYGDNLGNWAVTLHHSITVLKKGQTLAALTANWPGYLYKWQTALLGPTFLKEVDTMSDKLIQQLIQQPDGDSIASSYPYFYVPFQNLLQHHVVDDQIGSKTIIRT